MLMKAHQHISRALAGCCAVLWLTGLLSVGQGNLTTQWTMPHCPSGQAQNSQHGHNHCTWHCGGFDLQSCSGRGEVSTSAQVSWVWSLGDIPFQGAAVDGEFPPRGPPQGVLEMAWHTFSQGAGIAPSVLEALTNL